MNKNASKGGLKPIVSKKGTSPPGPVASKAGNNGNRLSDEFTRGSTYVVEESNTPNKPVIKETKPTLTQMIQQRKAEMMKDGQQREIEIYENKSKVTTVSFFNGNNNAANKSKSLDKILQNARQSGQLNLSDMSLEDGWCCSN